MASCGFCGRSGVSVDNGFMCDSCRTARAIAKQTKQSSSSSSDNSSSDVSEFQRKNRYGLLGYYLLFNCVIVAFGNDDKGIWSLFGFLSSPFLDAVLTYLVGLGSLYLLWRWMWSNGSRYKHRKGYKFAGIVLIALNLFLIYAIIDLFVDALPLLP